MTPCNQSSFEFAPQLSRPVVARFDGGTMASDAGGLLLRETDRRRKLLPRLARCCQDQRDPRWVSHSVEPMVAQRVYALAQGYEDLTDHDQLRQDPLLAVLAGKEPVEEEPWAGKSTLNRLESGIEQPRRYEQGYFDSYCSLPRYLFCGEHRLGARLRTAGQDASVGRLKELGGSWGRSGRSGPSWRSSCRRIRASAGRS